MAGFHTKTFLKYDDYMTPDYAWRNVQDFIPKGKVVWEPFFGDGTSGHILTELGFVSFILTMISLRTTRAKLSCLSHPFLKKKRSSRV